MKRSNKLRGILGEGGGGNIATKVYAATAVLILVAVATGFYSNSSLSKQREIVVDSESSSTKWSEAMTTVVKAQESYKTQVQEWKNTLLRGHDQKEYDKYWSSFQKNEAAFQSEIRTALNQLKGLGVDTSKAEDWIPAHEELGSKYRSALAAFAGERTVENIRAVDADVRGIDRAIGNGLMKLVDDCTKQRAASAETLNARADEAYGSARAGSIVWLVLGALTAIGMGFLLTRVFKVVMTNLEFALAESTKVREEVEGENRALQGNIIDLLEVVSDAADGNLGVRAKVDTGSLGNVADALNQMLESWSELLQEIGRTTDRTRTASVEIGEASAKMADGASHQVLAISDASDSVTQMTDSIRRVTQNAQNAVQAATRTKASAEQGSASVQTVIHGMDTLRSNVQAGAKKIKNLGDRSMEITGIVGTIAKISEQTNMLALNAAIEAARAGEHGRGFSVVAEEVRKLAERTAAATHEIESLITGIQAETSESVEAIESQTQVVEEESLAVAQAGEVLMRIQGDSTHSAELVTEITSTTQSQVETATSTVKKMEEVSGIARQTQLGANTALALTKSLDEVVSQLQASISRFKLD